MADFSFDFKPSGQRRREDTPFVLAVIADLSGSPAEPLEMVTDRNFLEIDVDNLDSRLRAARPRVAFRVPNAVTGQGDVGVDLTFRDLESFSPAAVASQVGLLTTLAAARARLAAMKSRAGAPGTRQMLAEVLDDPALVDALVGQPAPEADATPEPPRPTGTAEAGALSDLERLLGKPAGGTPPPQAPSPLQGLFEQAAADTPQLSGQAAQTIGDLTARLDQAIGGQLDLILHHPDYQALEGTWRGLNYLIENADTDETLKIRVLNASRAELASMLETGGLLGENPLAAKLRGDSYGILVVDILFGHSPADIALLGALGQWGLPVVGGAAPSLFGLRSWRELRATTDTLQRLAGQEYAAWRQLVDSPVSDRLFLTMPRVLARLPYGRKTNPAEGIEFEEQAPVGQPGAFTWSNSAWAMAAVVARAASSDGWAAALTPGGEDSQVDGLACLTFTNRDGDREMMCPTEVPMTVEFGVLLAKTGLAPLLHLKHTDRAVFVRVPTLGGRG